MEEEESGATPAKPEEDRRSGGRGTILKSRAVFLLLLPLPGLYTKATLSHFSSLPPVPQLFSNFQLQLSSFSSFPPPLHLPSLASLSCSRYSSHFEKQRSDSFEQGSYTICFRTQSTRRPSLVKICGGEIPTLAKFEPSFRPTKYTWNNSSVTVAPAGTKGISPNAPQRELEKFASSISGRRWKLRGRIAENIPTHPWNHPDTLTAPRRSRPQHHHA